MIGRRLFLVPVIVAVFVFAFLSDSAWRDMPDNEGAYPDGSGGARYGLHDEIAPAADDDDYDGAAAAGVTSACDIYRAPVTCEYESSADYIFACVTYLNGSSTCGSGSDDHDPTARADLLEQRVAEAEYIWENSFASSTREAYRAQDIACGDVERAVEIINACARERGTPRSMSSGG